MTAGKKCLECHRRPKAGMARCTTHLALAAEYQRKAELMRKLQEGQRNDPLLVIALRETERRITKLNANVRKEVARLEKKRKPGTCSEQGCGYLAMPKSTTCLAHGRSAK